MDTDQLPPTQKGRHHEIRALALRDFAGLRFDDEPLDPFALAKYAKLMIPSFEDIEGLTDTTRRQLLDIGKDDWSGGAASIKLPNGWRLIILNPNHGKNRHNATLMEEVSHVFLGHKPSRLAIRNTNKDGKTIARDYRQEIEEEAYGTGAAALLPYTAIKRMAEDGMTVAQIARHFNVSRALVEYRLKISRLWNTYKDNVFAGSSTSAS